MLEDDVEHIRSTLLSVLDGENPLDVVLALHSYSGLPGTDVIQDLNQVSRAKKGKDTAVRGVLYTAAHIPEVGESIRGLMLDNFLDLLPEPFRSGWLGRYKPAFPPEAAPQVYTELNDPAEMQKYGSMISRHANNSFDGRCSFAGWESEDSECVLILPELDQTIPVVVQKWVAKSRSAELRMRAISSTSFAGCYR